MSSGFDVQSQSEWIEQQAQVVENCADPVTRNAALELVRSVMELHASALQRILEVIAEAQSQELKDALARDPLVSSVLLLHDLHPQGLQQRISRALEQVNAVHLARHHAQATLVGIEDQAIQVKLEASPQCGSTLEQLRSLVEHTLVDAAPEAEIRVEIPPSVSSAFVSIETLRVPDRPGGPEEVKPAAARP